MPHPLLQRVARIADRARRVAVCAAVGRVLAVALGVALVLMLADYAMRLSDPGMRWLFAGLLLAAVAAAAVRWLSGAAWRGVTPLTVAQQIQADRPTLGSRLASAIEFLQQRTDDPSAGSADLRRAVVFETTADVEQLPLEEVIDHRPLRRAGQWVAACVAVAVVFGVADPAGLQTAAARLVAPWSDQHWPRRNHLAVDEAPGRIARGQSFEARILDEHDARLPADLKVQYRTRVGGATRVEEQALPSTGSEVNLLRENVQQAFAYRVVGGDDNSMAWRQVEVVDPPQVSDWRLTSTPPAYSGLPAQSLREEGRVLEGSSLGLNGRTPEELSAGELIVVGEGEQQPLPLTLQPISGETSLSLAAPWLPQTDGAGPRTVSYRLRVASAGGLEGQTKPRSLRIEPDAPPAIDWLTPAPESYVTARAVVPVSVLAEDNLAIAKAELLWRREATEPLTSTDDEPGAVQPADETPAEATAERIIIYTGPESPPERASLPWDSPADSRELSHELALEPLGLSPGDQILLLVEAADYRPGVGVTPLPRRIIIITDEEFDSRLADMQSELVQDLSRLLAEQREARAAAGELTIDRQSSPQTTPQTLDRLSAIGFEQLRINEGVSDERRGAAARAEELLDELARNQQDRPELREQLEALRDGLRQLSDGPLANAGRDLADARRSAQQAAEQADGQPNAAAEKEVDRSLADAAGQQDRAIESLEGMVERMSGWSDYQRFAQELADLEREQRELREETLKEAARAAASLPSPERTAAREKLRAAQSEIAKRFGKLQDAMRKAADQSQGDQSEGGAQKSDAAQALQDALAESRDNATRGKLDEAQRQLGDGQLGRSAAEQEAGADDMRSMLETLRDRASSDPKELAEQLREAQEKLAELQKELDELKQQADQPGQQRQQQKLADQTERMSRKLDRLGAQQAGQSTQQGAQKMEQSAEQSRQGESGSESLADAQEQLKKAQEQLEQEIERQKQIHALRVLDRLAGRLPELIERQTKLLEGTVGAEQESQAGAAGEDFEAGVRQLAEGQQGLREDVEVARRNVEEREVFELALRGAVADMDQALELLAKPEVSRPTQQRQYSALQRLKHVSDALKLNPPPEEEQEEQQQGGGQGGQPGQPPPPSPVDVAELKMLRLMQLDVNAQTRELEGEAADNRLTPAEARRQADELSDRQQRLGDLVQELIERINERQTNPGELPDDAA
ncbi:hypothetical protein KOR34_33940 [Posidoniimonas corsicana]|uniref:Uncharacterized protein n=1 Tax=Posidoniimonas corsicana TaxID=1938618 RepID=A0A5C5V759_9BACT|nr:hypothetical protein [Posidoniimonas corsicana]TWT33562.1 hypothetical protein KOR34_33940 [Posidoniimonas corsicana]